ncbi:MAG: hypothetical protein A2289_06205 [Deltaproteobacteria bacterium RIFOXYA12_FULL_58_15]|nr:MAG: hypothetical protein A2289_06205 [Deltaproteobacteria bacterium RIFOXYA12_FULL_58_15]
MIKKIDGYRFSEKVAAEVAKEVGIAGTSNPEDIAVAAKDFDGFVMSRAPDGYLDRDEYQRAPDGYLNRKELYQGARELFVDSKGSAEDNVWKAAYEYKGKSVELESDEAGNSIKINGRYVESFDWSITLNGIVCDEIKGVYSTPRQLAEALIDKGVY